MLIALSLNFWGFKPIVFWSDSALLFIELGYLALGYLMFHRKVTFFDKRLKGMWWIILGILLSMVTANLYYGQSYSTSLIAYRANFLWLAIPVLIRMSPSFKQIAKSSLIITTIMYILYFLRAASPGMFIMDDETLMRFQQGEDIYLAGYTFASIPILYYLTKLHERVKTNYVAIITFCYVYIFILQNRTQIFIMTVIIGYSIFRVKSKYKFFIVIILAAILLYFIIDTSQHWIDMFQETQDQINDPDYNRNKAYVYFLTMASPNVWCQIFGNGFLSSKTTSLMQDMMALGIYNSDVGFVGYWNNYGIIPIIVFIYTFILAFKNKNEPYGVKMWSLMLIGGVATTSYFHGAPLIYTLFYYLLMQYRFRYFDKELV